MNNMEVIITDEAFQDIDDISDFIASDNVQEARKVIDMFFECFDMLAKFPNLGVEKRNIKTKNTKIFIIKKQYLVAYKIANEKLIIFKVSYRYQNIYSIL
ncbi:type II toxin-antitoxin system RelE/ParE family toxin [bacterium]|nr:type II toxin-antitoxin system RelE/ParE family toxin [bacterium]